MDTFSCFTAPRDACPPFLRPSSCSLALKSGLDCGLISMRLQGKTVEITGKNGRDCRAIPPLLQMHSKEDDRERTVHVDRKDAARGDAS